MDARRKSEVDSAIRLLPIGHCRFRNCLPYFLHVLVVPVFLSRPEKSFQSIAFRSGNNVYVEMRNALTHTIIDRHERSLGSERFFKADRDESRVG